MISSGDLFPPALRFLSLANGVGRAVMGAQSAGIR
jgi:hypothetical protein